MFKIFLRNEKITERMDDLLCDPFLLSNTYKQFSKINSLLSRWRFLYITKIKPIIREIEHPTLLDIGFGGGDVAFNLQNWAIEDGIDLNITAVDSDPRALNFVNDHYKAGGLSINFRHCNIDELIVEGKKYDIVISNHVLHHLLNDQVLEFLEKSKNLANVLVLHNDLRRSIFAYGLFQISKLIFKKSYIVEDGLISIRRSFTVKELKQICGLKWKVDKYLLFRILVSLKR